MKIPTRWTVILAGAALQLFISSAEPFVTPVTAATGELRDIKGPLPPGRIFPYLIPGGVAVILAGKILALVIMRRRKRRRNPLPETAPLSIEAAFDLLESRFRGRPEDTGILYEELSHLVRVWLEQRTGLPASRMTTEELQAESAMTGHSPPEQADLLRVVLPRCDLVKFAGYRPSTPETEATLAVTRSILRGNGAGSP